MNQEPVLELGDIQGAIVPGFAKDHQYLLFLEVVDPGSAKPFIAGLGDAVATADEALAARRLWRAMRARLGREPGADLPIVLLGCAFTASGLRRLVPAEDVEAFADASFKMGLADRSAYLGDPVEGEGAAENWLAGGPGTPVDLALLIASDDRDRLEEALAGWRAEAEANGLRTIHVERGHVAARNREGHEHFGFKDGVSQPALRGRRSDQTGDFLEPRAWPFEADPLSRTELYASPGRPLVWPGHFLFGYPRQMRDEPLTPHPTNVAIGPAWARNGSFLVYRRLRQDVAAFAGFIEATAAALAARLGPAAPGPGKLAAMLVGRWPSGTALSLSPDEDKTLPEACENEFSFATARQINAASEPILCPADIEGRRCPLGAHIRKVNPRDDTTDIGPEERTFQKLLLRRGITFDRSIDPAGEDERGLVFLAFQSSIVDQFEFLMTQWINSADRPLDMAGHDPILGQAADRFVELPIAGGVERIDVPGGWVVPTAGAYLFMPGRRFLAELVAGG